MENIFHLQVLDDSELETTSENSSDSCWPSENSVHATLGFWSSEDKSDDDSIRGGPAALHAPTTVNEVVAPFLGGQKSASFNNEGEDSN